MARKIGARGRPIRYHLLPSGDRPWFRFRFSQCWRALFVLGLAAICSGASARDFFEHDGLALRGYDPVAYFTEQRAVKGAPELTLQHRGSTFRFASRANLEAFQRDAERYAPQYGGYCAYGTARGYKAAIDPEAFRIVDGKLYLNYNTSVQREWSKDVPGYIEKADRNWPTVSRQDKVHRYEHCGFRGGEQRLFSATVERRARGLRRRCVHFNRPTTRARAGARRHPARSA